jgi:hypothetical protein
VTAPAVIDTGDDLYSEYLKEKGGSAGDSDLYSQYLKEQASNPSTYGLEPASSPPPKKRGSYKSPIPPEMIAQPDVTETRATGSSLAAHLAGEHPPLPVALIETARHMATHPVEIATGIVEQPFKAGETLRKYTRGEATGSDAAIQALQTAALAGAGPLEGVLEKPLATLVGDALARAAATTAVGGAAGATFTPDRPAVGAILGAAGGATQLPEALRNVGDVSEGALKAGARSLTPSGPPVDQPAPLTPEQALLRARLATEDITPVGAIGRRPAEPIREPAPDAQPYSTTGAVRRPAPQEPIAEATTPLQAEYDAEQAAPVELAPASEPASGPTATEVVPLGGPESATWPPLPAATDIRPVASANGEFNVRPGIMRDVNRGVQPEALPSPLRLPQPTPADLAVVQPRGVKEITPADLAAREPVAVAEPRQRERLGMPTTVDESGLFFEHRTPSGALRDFRRVSTDGLIKAQREIQGKIIEDQQASIYRNVEADVSGTQYGQHINVGTRTSRGTTYQAEALQRLKNYDTVMGRIDKELASRGLSNSDIYDRIQEQEQLEAAIEQEAIHHADSEQGADDAFGDFEEEGGAVDGRDTVAPLDEVGKQEPPISDVLNVAKLNLGNTSAEQRVAAKLEDFRAQRDANKQTFAEADVNREQILNELRAGDPLALPTSKAKALSGEELLARRDLVRENDKTIQELSRQMDSGTLPEDSYRQAADLVERAVSHNDALLSDLVTGSSQKGRDLNLLRRLANDSTDPAVWRIQAKRMLGDQPLTAEIDAAIRKLASDAEEACK